MPVHAAVTTLPDFMTQFHGEITDLVLEVIIFIQSYRKLMYCIFLSLDIFLHTIVKKQSSF